MVVTHVLMEPLVTHALLVIKKMEPPVPFALLVLILRLDLLLALVVAQLNGQQLDLLLAQVVVLVVLHVLMAIPVLNVLLVMKAIIMEDVLHVMLENIPQLVVPVLLVLMTNGLLLEVVAAQVVEPDVIPVTA